MVTSRAQVHVIRRALPFLLIPALLPAASAHAAVTKRKAISGPVEFNGDSQFANYAKLGAGIYVSTLDYKAVAVQDPENATDPDDPGYQWPDDLDEAISDAATYHIQIALKLENGSKDFATAAAKRFPDVHLWVVQQTKESTSAFTKTLNGEYAALKARAKKNTVVGQPKSASVPKGAKLDMFGYTPAKDKQLPDLSKLHDKVKKNLFVTGWTLNTAGQAGAKQLAAGLKAAKKASYVYTLGYDGLYDTGEVGSDGRIPKTGLLANDGTKRPAYDAFRKG
jgi:hypothetical protein